MADRTLSAEFLAWEGGKALFAILDESRWTTDDGYPRGFADNPQDVRKAGLIGGVRHVAKCDVVMHDDGSFSFERIRS